MISWEYINEQNEQNEQGERYGEIVVGCQVVSVGGVGCLVVVVDVVVVVLRGWGVA